MSRLWRRLLIIFASVAVVLVGLRLALPFAVQWGLEWYLSEEGNPGRIGEVELNLTEGELILRDARGFNAEQKGFRVERAYIDFDWRPFGRKHLAIRRVEIRGLYLDFNRAGDGFTVAGIAPWQQALAAQAVEQEVALIEAQAQLGIGWGVDIGPVMVEDSAFCFDQGETGATAPSSCLYLGQLHWDGQVELGTHPELDSTELGLFGEGQLQLAQVAIATFNDHQTLLKLTRAELPLRLRGNQLHWDDAQLAELHINAAPWAAHAGALEQLTSSGQLRIPAADHDLSVEAAAQVRALRLDYEQRPWLQAKALAAPTLTVAGGANTRLGAALNLDALTLLRQGGEPWLQLASAQVQGLSGQGQQWRAEQVRLAELRALPDGEGEHLRWQRLQLTGVDVGAERLLLDKVELIAPVVRATRTADGTIPVLQRWRDALASVPGLERDTDLVVAESTAAPPVRTTVAENIEVAPYAVRINAFSLSQGVFDLHDQHVTPTFDQRFHDVQVQADQLHTDQPAQNSPLRLVGQFGAYGELRLEGNAKPFLPRPSAQLSGEIKAFDLTEVAGYVQRYTAYRLQRGQLNSQIDWTMTRGELDSQLDLTLVKLKLVPARPDQTTELDQQLGVPLEVALALLRDDNDNIDLQLPVQGDIEAPDFSLADAFRQVLVVAIRNAIINYYTPFGIVNLAEGMFDLATALRFEPLPFEPGEARLNDAARERLQQMATLLQERPQVELVFCGELSEADREVLFPPPPPPASGAVVPGEPLPGEQVDALTELARTRADNAREFLAEQGVAPTRIILCSPDQPVKAVPPQVRIEM